MQLTRRHLIITGAVSAAALAAPAVLRAEEKLTVTISHGAPTYQALIAELSSQFALENPSMAVKFVADGDNWDPLLNSTLRASVVGALPDGTWQSLTYARILANRKIAQPVNQFIGNDIKNLQAMGLSKPMIEATTVGSNVYCLPYGTTIPIVYCNMDLLRKAGYSKPQPPSTWDEIHQIGVKVAAMRGNINGGYIEYSSTNAWIFQNLLASYGGRMMNEAQTAIAFDGGEGLQSLQTLFRFGDIGTTDMTIDQARQAFNAGVTAMHIRSASGTTSVAKATAGSFDLAVAQFPLPGPNGRLVGAGHGFFMFAKDPAKQKVVWEFMKFATSSKGQLILAKNTGYIPTNLMALDDRAFLDQYFKINPFHRSVVERLAITGDQFSFPSDSTVKIVQMMANEMRNVVTHKAKPNEALTRMVAQTRKMLG
ncbi:extracellular solute-binding protein [Mesorhizobium australafricanum]|uniref:Extracellular solute-binding protein n=1 Tax=Mesorhizobium australafricanum TaxID=3072311 RepID=A0ABU4X5J3_9HYPH|nr:extracellular solute-binding protein [Mesorhizobium sp. VK3E]MDX8443208.1 extracellular solute-binding protein [Mesorhizobium sp. VK3E]